MNYRKLGNLTVSSVGLGCMGMSQSYGAPADKKEMCELIAAAVDMGITLFDTAEVYGTPDDPHDNEKLVGAALAPYRDKVVLATKFGIHFDMSLLKEGKSPIVPDARPEVIRASVDSSLQRLGTDYIDLYYQHRVDPKIPVEEVAGVMGDLIKEGKIRHWGISEATEEDIRRAHAVCPLTAVQNRYSMMARAYESLFPVLEERNIGFVAFSPFANGVLTGAYDASSTYAREYAAVHRGGDGGESIPAHTPARSRGEEGRNERADCARVDALQEAVYRADSGHAQAFTSCGECRGGGYCAHA